MASELNSPVQRRNQMKLIAFPLVAVAALAGVVALTAPAVNQEGAPIFVTEIPPGYRDWRLISVALKIESVLKQRL